MPTYEYRCPNGHAFDLFQKMSAEPGANCPECGEPSERQLSGGAGFLFKGDGFYITDYRSDSYKKAAASDPGSAGATGAGGSAKASGGSEQGSTGASGPSSPAPSPTPSPSGKD